MVIKEANDIQSEHKIEINKNPTAYTYFGLLLVAVQNNATETRSRHNNKQQAPGKKKAWATVACANKIIPNESTCKNSNERMNKTTKMYHGIDLMPCFNNGTQAQRLMLMNL